MTERRSEPVVAVTNRRPARHGTPWEQDEVETLLEEIRQGLTLAELAERHQRTPAGITGTAIRLLPRVLRPEHRTQAINVLANYLHENGGACTRQLIASFRPTRTSTIRPRDALRVYDLQTHTKLVAYQAVVDEMIGSELVCDQIKSAESPSGVAQESLRKVVIHPNDTDVGMLLTAAVAGMPEAQDRDRKDRDVLCMRLGMDGDPLTLSEIGAKFGFSRERARQRQERALRRLASGARKAGTPGALLKAKLALLRDDDGALTRWLLDVVSRDFEIPPRFAAKFILRAAGYAKAKAEEVADEVSSKDRTSRAHLRELARDHAATQRVESVVTRWLEGTEWPDTIVPPPSATQLSAHRTVNEHEIAGSFQSDKLGRSVNYESGLERTVLTTLERSGQIAYYQEQPAQIRYTFDRRQRSYFPDIFAATTDGRGLLIEVKPTDNMALSINRAKAGAARAWAHARGWGWLIVSDRCTFRDIEEHIIPSAAVKLLESELEMRGILTWREVEQLRAKHGFTRFDFTAYIIQSGAELDRAYRVTARGTRDAPAT